MARSISHDVIRLRDLSNGTPLSVSIADGKLTLTAAGMEPIQIALPVTDLVVTDELREQVCDMTMLTYEATRTSPAAFLVCASMMAADRAGAYL